MCKFKIKQFYQQPANLVLRKKLETINAGSCVFVKWYDIKARKIRYTAGLLIAKKNKGLSSHILIRRTITKERLTFLFYVYSPTFLGIGQLFSPHIHSTAYKAKYYNATLRPIRWKYL
jgi:ribosomal protein L19